MNASEYNTIHTFYSGGLLRHAFGFDWLIIVSLTPFS
jgi:hypothetical protein